jgi:type I restriction enzyme S subunit
MKTSQWNTIPLRDLCELIQYGYTASASREQVGPKFLRITDIVPALIDWNDVPFCSIEPDQESKYSLSEGDIVIARTGATTGYAKLIKNPPKSVFASYLVRLRIKPEYDSEYVGLVVESEHYKEFIAAHKGGAAQPNANAQVLTSYPLRLPSLPTQRKIAGVLSAYEQLIGNNARRIAILEEMAQAVYREWFVNFRFPGHEKVKLINSPLGKIPDGWKWAKLKDVCDSVNYGYTASANKEVEVGPRFLRITDIVPDTIDWENVPYCEVDDDNADKYALSEGDIVIARTGATTGYAKRLHKRHPKTVFASYLVRIVPNKVMGKHYVGLIVESDDYKAFIKRNLSGAAQPQANAQVLTSLEVLVPSPEVIAAFDCQVEPLADQKELLQIKNRNLRKTRDLLLPKLITGQLDVEELDIETGEPLVEAEA